jgi:hypothetical protein
MARNIKKTMSTENPRQLKLAEKKAALKASLKISRRRALHGHHNWGDFYRNEHIKELRREIQILSTKD